MGHSYCASRNHLPIAFLKEILSTIEKHIRRISVFLYETSLRGAYSSCPAVSQSYNFTFFAPKCTSATYLSKIVGEYWVGKLFVVKLTSIEVFPTLPSPIRTNLIGIKPCSTEFWLYSDFFIIGLSNYWLFFSFVGWGHKFISSFLLSFKRVFARKWRSCVGILDISSCKLTGSFWELCCFWIRGYFFSVFIGRRFLFSIFYFLSWLFPTGSLLVLFILFSAEILEWMLIFSIGGFFRLSNFGSGGRAKLLIF